MVGSALGPGYELARYGMPNPACFTAQNPPVLPLGLGVGLDRVGRGSVDSTCLLLYKPPLSPTATTRLAAMRETNDGFLSDIRARPLGEDEVRKAVRASRLDADLEQFPDRIDELVSDAGVEDLAALVHCHGW